MTCFAFLLYSAQDWPSSGLSIGVRAGTSSNEGNQSASAPPETWIYDRSVALQRTRINEAEAIWPSRDCIPRRIQCGNWAVSDIIYLAQWEIIPNNEQSTTKYVCTNKADDRCQIPCVGLSWSKLCHERSVHRSRWNLGLPTCHCKNAGGARILISWNWEMLPR